MLDYSSSINDNGLVLFLDFFKAFDSLEHSILFKALKHFSFGPFFCNAVKMLSTTHKLPLVAIFLY